MAFNFNKKGLRDRDYSHKRIPGKMRILVLGDSFAWGSGVDQKYVFTEQMEIMLKETEVINAGVNGYSTDQELLWLKKEGLKYNPDLVILTFCGNDAYENHLGLVYRIYHKPFFIIGEDGQLILQNVPVPRQPFYKKIISYLGQYSSLAFKLNRFMAMAFPKYSQVWVQKQEFFPDRNTDSNKKFRLILTLMNEIKSISNKNGAQFMIISTGKYWRQIKKVEFYTYEEMVQVLRDNKFYILNIDALSGYSKDGFRLSKRNYHWNRDGHRFVAKKTIEFIRKNKILKTLY